MAHLAVCSFWVHRPRHYPEAPDYLPLLEALDRSCGRLNSDHLVLTDWHTQVLMADSDLTPIPFGLPDNLMRALTEAQARWLELENSTCATSDTLFVGADCLIRRDPRGHIPPGDLAIAFRPDSKRHRLQNGFMYVPAASRTKVAPLFRSIADACGKEMCDDLVAIERALSPMPETFGPHKRAGLTVNFVPMMPWQGAPDAAEDPIEDAIVLHFRGRRRKALMLEWAARHLPEAA